MTVYPVILAGGKGTRLWPMSRADKPKQFLPMHGEHSLFQKTVERHLGLDGIGHPVIVCGENDRFQVDDGLKGIGVGDAHVVIEPSSRNTAPAIAAAAEVLLREDPEAILFVLPSDHLVQTDEGYFKTVDAAVQAAREGKMVTFGVMPTHPETGYGYIEAGAGDAMVRPVASFVEKPPADEAARMVAAGGYYWNAGFFAFSAKALLDELKAHAPDVVAAAVAAVDAAGGEPGLVNLGAAAWAGAPDISIDYALFERTDKAVVAPISCRWSDVGSWHAYWDSLEKDEAGNAVRGKAITLDTTDSLIVAGERDVVALGLDKMAVVAVEDAILVCPLERSQDVKKVVTLLKERRRNDILDVSPTVNRPWGGYTSIMNGPRFQVKHLFVSPGKRLSLQKHYHRAEHWVVVRGTAEVTIDDKVITLSENQSTYLPLGCVHRLANPGRIMLEVIEVQTGSYLGEDDIVRLQDEWGRT
ncbi:mannose-1-phosphate guanylyltransferase/mannose-6-phosphate isomerase [Acuticoccus yangtzensis]|uniref:mannose-1-phosphate guanylyltransferase/mannose-6-phosphate isomerase n=1 Tax=Acuticoccus yangtzensis TaxID=1443441 RepID=UPI0009497E1D|nr:mannose-1-phosphate guanylyltransferase/mannose-6-phosphate isomerase [Acuticoccus yangtzensis]ORE95367.1 mannose-1-phosphate guanylyltransferase [Stappia sp. 22II-S9-Z10]